MAEYISFEPHIEAGGSDTSLLSMSTISCTQRNAIMEKYDLDDSRGAWNDLQSLLNAMKEISEKNGEMDLFQMGKAIINNTYFPPVEDLEAALRAMDISYHMSHRKNGKPMFDPMTGQMSEGIGHCRLASFDSIKKEAVMVCHTPYPAKLEEGLICQLVKRFRPADSLLPKIKLDRNREDKAQGGDTCSFIIKW